MEKIKILHIITHLPTGGAQDNTLFTVELLNRKKFDISLCCNFVGELVDRAKRIEKINIFNVKYLVREVNFFKDMLGFISIYKIIKTEKFHIIHTHSSKAGFLARIAAKLCGGSIVVHTVHGFPFNDYMNVFKKYFYINIEKFLSTLSDAIITVSNLNKNKIIELKISEHSKITNIYSGIDLKLFRKKNDFSFRDELKIPDDFLLIGSVGRLSVQKDPLTLVNAFELVLKEKPSVKLVFVGDGELKHEVQKNIKELGLQRSIYLIGNKMDPWNVYPSLDLFVMSSIYEGLGRSITEALCGEVPVVCTNVEGVPELVQDEITGYLVKPKDYNDLARGILKSINDIEHSKDMAKVGSKFVNENFDVKIMVKKIDDLYCSLINKM